MRRQKRPNEFPRSIRCCPSAARSTHIWHHLPTVPEALASLMRTVVVALFLLTFVLQPFLIPSESMEHTLLVGDFLLVNKQIFAPSGNEHSLNTGDAVSTSGAGRYCRVSSSRSASLPGQARHRSSGRPACALKMDA